MKFERNNNTSDFSYLIELEPKKEYELKPTTLQELRTRTSYKRAPNAFVLFRSDFQRLLKCSVGKASSLACIFWEMADAVLREHYTDIYKKLSDETPPKWEFKLFIPPRERRKKLKGSSSPASAKILPSVQHLSKKDTTDPCPSTPSVALPDNQLELDLNSNSEGPSNFHTEILPSAQHLNNEYTIDPCPSTPSVALPDKQFELDLNSNNIYCNIHTEIHPSAPKYTIDLCPSTPPDADRRLPGHQTQQWHNCFEFYEGPILFPCNQEWLWNSPPVTVPIPLTHNNCSNYEVTSSHPTVELGYPSEYYMANCLDENALYTNF
ncbi:7383_t:CDS:2 [Paraglomus brasilianum]|uniref:7383_t:CDS:1 n=1 Tax=Paraglomus brasilianum TaxID=144538 RepID=A0A9N9BVT6_9GLOM|nr:7383_t:CDS:2 [Paraglomus brasilianum]